VGDPALPTGVIVLVFSGTPRDGHRASPGFGDLGREAFTAAATRNKFPEQLKYVDRGSPKQCSGSRWNFGTGEGGCSGQDPPEKTLDVDTGEFEPLLGIPNTRLPG